MPSKQKQAVLHPFVFGLYPVVFLYTANRERFDFSVMLVPATVTVLLAGLVWLGLRAVLSDWDRAGAMTSAFLMATFSFSAVAGVFEDMAEGEEMTLWSKILGICLACCRRPVIATFRSPQLVGKTNYLLNVVSIFLVTAPLFQTGLWNLSMARSPRPCRIGRSSTRPRKIDKNQQRPDIYYFVLDGYGREDFLRRNSGTTILR